MSDGHSDVGAGEECDIDFGNFTDDLPREDVMERDPPGEDVRDLPGPPLRGASGTNQEERYQLEPPNGARPKWTRPGRPLPVIEEPRSPGAGATVDVDGPGMNGAGGEFRPQRYRQDRQSAGVAPTPTRMDADRHGTAAWQGDTIGFSRFC